MVINKKDVNFADREDVIAYIHSLLDHIHEEVEEVMPLKNLLCVIGKLAQAKDILDNPRWEYDADS